MALSDNKHWDIVISPQSRWFGLNIADLWRYRDLILLFVRRDFVTYYKQTFLGPLWYIIVPLFNTLVFTVIFGKIARIPTDGVPPFLFYLAGNVVWGYFAQCVNGISNTFVTNAQIFSKVFFPRLTVPISVVISGLFQFVIQFSIFLMVLGYFKYSGSNINPNRLVLTLPLILLQMAILGFGIGICVSSLTTKYRDLQYVIGFFVQLWLYMTPIVYPLSQIPSRFHLLYSLNPMVSTVEVFRAAFLGTYSIEFVYVILSVFVTLAIFFTGVLLFNRVEKTFVDTI